MLIESSAPTRIDLAGGTLDIWPLYLFHEGAQTLNVAISLRARCFISPRTDDRIAIVSEDTGVRVKRTIGRSCSKTMTSGWSARILHYFQAKGLEVRTRSESPVGAGIAGSSALNIAVCGAVAKWCERAVSDDLLMLIAQNVEAQVIDVPTGVQDYRPALYGGINAVELSVDGVRRVPLAVTPTELQERLVLAYTNASRNSGINNWDVTKRHIDGDRDVRDGSDGYATLPSRCARRSSGATGLRSVTMSQTNGTTANVLRRALQPRTSTQCSPQPGVRVPPAGRSAAPEAAGACSASANRIACRRFDARCSRAALACSTSASRRKGSPSRLALTPRSPADEMRDGWRAP